MKILVCNPPFMYKFSREQRSPAVTKSGTLYYPMWLAYAAGYLEKQGNEILFFDAPAYDLSFDEIEKKTRAFGPSLAVIATSTPSIYNDIEVAVKLKKAVSGLFVVLVGVHVSALPLKTLDADRNIDAVVIGEYEETLAELAEKLEKHGNDINLREIKGLAVRDSSGKPVLNEKRPLIEDLDHIPFVSSVYKKHLPDIKPYFYGHSRWPIMVIVTGRGCPFHCTYCVYPQTMHGHRYRKRSIENLVEEFRFIKNNFRDIKEIMIEDDTLTVDRKRCREFSERLISEKLTGISWSANSRADVDYDTLRTMKKAGCRLLCVGFESGDQEILDNIKKGTKIDKIRQFMKDARSAGVLVHGCFMVGNRGETRQTLEKTLEFAKELNPDTAQFFPIMVYPGTEDYQYFDDKGWIVNDNFRAWLTDEGLHNSVVSNPDLKYEYLVEFCDRARKEFYLRPSYILSKIVQIFKNPGEGVRVLKAARTFFRYLFRSSKDS